MKRIMEQKAEEARANLAKMQIMMPKPPAPVDRSQPQSDGNNGPKPAPRRLSVNSVPGKMISRGAVTPGMDFKPNVTARTVYTANEHSTTKAKATPPTPGQQRAAASGLSKVWVRKEMQERNVSTQDLKRAISKLNDRLEKKLAKRLQPSGARANEGISRGTSVMEIPGPVIPDRAPNPVARRYSQPSTKHGRPRSGRSSAITGMRLASLSRSRSVVSRPQRASAPVATNASRPSGTLYDVRKPKQLDTSRGRVSITVRRPTRLETPRGRVSLTVWRPKQLRRSSGTSTPHGERSGSFSTSQRRGRSNSSMNRRRSVTPRSDRTSHRAEYRRNSRTSRSRSKGGSIRN